MSIRSCMFLMMFAAASVFADEDRVIISFEEPDSAKKWESVNDGVMGGISEGGFKLSDEQSLIFSGTLSLERNGGFASIRTIDKNLGLKGMYGLKVKVRGDGRTYWLGLQKANQFGPSSYRAYLPTKKDEWTETIIPFSDFKYQAFGRNLPGGSAKPEKVASIGFTIADKKAGPFELEIQSVKALAKRPNSKSE